MPPLNIFDQIAGLPVHPLVVHAAVVLLPLSALALLAVIFVRRLRKPYALPAVVGVTIGAAAVAVARASGEQLATYVGLPARHAELATWLTIAAIALNLVAIAWWLLQRRDTDDQTSSAARITGWLAAGLIVPTLVLTVLVGHSGAETTWGGRLSAQDEPAATTSTPATPASSASAPASTSEPTPPSAQSTSQPDGFTLAEVAQHATPESCWAAVDGEVYDLTDWIGQHPGGEQRIVQICGTDAGQAFDAQHGRNQLAQSELERFRIGTLVS